MEIIEGESKIKRINDSLNIVTTKQHDEYILALAKKVANDKSTSNVTQLKKKEPSRWTMFMIPLSLAAGILLGVTGVLLVPARDQTPSIVAEEEEAKAWYRKAAENDFKRERATQEQSQITRANNVLSHQEDLFDKGELMAWRRSSDQTRRAKIKKLIDDNQLDKASFLLEELKDIKARNKRKTQ